MPLCYQSPLYGENYTSVSIEIVGVLIVLGVRNQRLFYRRSLQRTVIVRLGLSTLIPNRNQSFSHYIRLYELR